MILQNVVKTFNIVDNFKTQNLDKVFSSYMERNFTTLSETDEFLELGYSLVAKTLASSNLNTDSEVQVFYAAEFWIKHNINERSKYAKDLFTKVRFSLLSDYALEHILHRILSLSELEDCAAKIHEILIRKECFFHKKDVKHRHCNQNMFDILVGGGYDDKACKYVKFLYKISGKDLNDCKRLKNMEQMPKLTKAFYLKGHIYFINGWFVANETKKHRIERNVGILKCSYDFKTFENVGDMWDEYDYFTDYCVCAFMDKFYIIGGKEQIYNRPKISSCRQFDTKNYEWKEVASMNEARAYASCAVFEGRVVVTGGCRENCLNTVEAYDHIADEWTYMPNMVSAVSDHMSIAIRNKLFVVKTDYTTDVLEVYDSTCKQFVALQGNTFFKKNYSDAVSSIGNTIVLLSDRSTIICYDIDTGKWSEEIDNRDEYLDDFFCVKVPQL